MNSSMDNNKCGGSGFATGAGCEYTENLDILRSIDFFAGMPMEGLKVFAFICTREKYKPGDYVYSQGDEDGRAFYIFNGKGVLVLKNNGEEEILRELDAGEFAGMPALLGDVARLYSFRAVTDMECMVISKDKFWPTITQFPELMPKMIKLIIDKVYAREKHFLENRNPDCHACQNNTGAVLT